MSSLLARLSPRLTAYLLLLVNTAAFGAAIPIVKWGIGDADPFFFLFSRMVVAGLVTPPIWYLYRQQLKHKFGLILKAFGIEILGTTLALGFLYFALQFSTAIEVSLLATAGPVFLAFFGLLFLREKVTPREWLGLGISASGIVFLTLAPALGDTWSSVFTGGWLVTLLMLGYHLTNSAYYTLAKPLYKKLPTALVPLASSWVGTFSFGLLSYGLARQAGSNWSQMFITTWSSPQFLWMIFYMAIIATVIGWTAYIKAQELIEISEAGLFTYLQPIFYIPLSLWLLGEKVVWHHGLSLALIIVGVLLAESGKSRRRRKAVTATKLIVSSQSHRLPKKRRS